MVAVRDTAGNIARETVVVSKFDMTEPTGFTITGVPKEWTSEKVTLERSQRKGQRQRPR